MGTVEWYDNELGTDRKRSARPPRHMTLLQKEEGYPDIHVVFSLEGGGSFSALHWSLQPRADKPRRVIQTMVDRG